MTAMEKEVGRETLLDLVNEQSDGSSCENNIRLRYPTRKLILKLRLFVPWMVIRILV